MTESAPSAPAAPHEYVVHARATHGGPAEVDAADTTLPLDAAWGAAPSGAPGPADLLASAFAACMLKNLARSGALLDFAYDDAEVEVVLHRQDTPPRFTRVTYDLRITTTEPERRIALVHTNLRKYGTVYNTLAAVCEVSGTAAAR